MPKVFENDIIFDYSPIQALSFLHRKYPNPFAKHVYTVDTISRTVDPELGIVRSERLIGVQQGAPKWIRKLFQLPETAYVREIVFIDPSGPSATCMSMNLSLKQYVSCLELITYTPSGEPSPPKPLSPTEYNSSFPSLASLCSPSADSSSSPSGPCWPGAGVSAPSTFFHQRALMISGFSNNMIARQIEKASLDRFAKNAGAGRKGFEWVLAGGQSIFQCKE